MHSLSLYYEQCCSSVMPSEYRRRRRGVGRGVGDITIDDRSGDWMLNDGAVRRMESKKVKMREYTSIDAIARSCMTMGFLGFRSPMAHLQGG